jgi:hypothetical protein
LLSSWCCCCSFDWLIDWLVNLFIEKCWLIDWLIDCFFDWFS